MKGGARFAWMLAAGIVALGGCGAAEPFTLWVAPDGSDGNDGATPMKPIATLERALTLVKMENPAGDIRIVLKPGTYHGQSVGWTYFNGHDIRFVGDGWPGLERKMPVFDGCPSAAFCAQRPNYFLKVVALDATTDTRVTVRHIEVRRYQNGIWFAGSIANPAGYQRENAVLDSVLAEIGNAGVAGLGMGYFAIGLDNARDTTIAGNTFSDIADEHPDESEIHGIYLSGHSSGNRIASNAFRNVSGVPVDVRNGSDSNLVEKNTFGGLRTAAFMDWYCDSAYNPGCKAASPECPSWNNKIVGNTFTGEPGEKTYCVIYYGEKPYGCERYRISGDAYAKTCAVPPSRLRVEMHGNSGGTGDTYPSR